MTAAIVDSFALSHPPRLGSGSTGKSPQGGSGTASTGASVYPKRTTTEYDTSALTTGGIGPNPYSTAQRAEGSISTPIRPSSATTTGRTNLPTDLGSISSKRSRGIGQTASSSQLGVNLRVRVA